MSPKINTIITHSHLQTDTLAALAILAYFGEEKYPGIGEAAIKFLSELPKGQAESQLEKEGVLILSSHSGKFSFKEKATLANQVIKDLGLENSTVVEKLNQYIKRIADQADNQEFFELGGLIDAVRYRYSDKPERVIQIILPLLEAHLWQEEQRQIILPKEYQKIKESEKLQEFTAFQGKKLVKIIMAESDVKEITYFLKDYLKTQPDVVVQRSSLGGIRIVTQPKRQIDLSGVIALLRIEEARKKKLPFDKIYKSKISSTGMVEGLEEWYYDSAANEIYSGDLAVKTSKVTTLSLEEIKDIIEAGLNPNRVKEKYPKFF